MATRQDIYKCEACGNIVEIVNGGDGELVCCGAPMRRMAENTVDAAREKHVPVIETVDGGVRVRVGDLPHPMEEKHHIQWIEVVANGHSYRQYLIPGSMPEAFFAVYAPVLTARAYCNLHELWKATSTI